MHLHHRLIDVHQLLQLQLLALVRQLAQRAALLQVRLQLDQPLQHLLVRLVLLPQAIVLVLRLTYASRTHLPTGTEHQVRVRVVHVGQWPVPAQQRLAQLLPLLLPVLQHRLAHLVRVHAVELQLLHEQRLQDVLGLTSSCGHYCRGLHLVLAAVLLRAVDHALEQVQTQLLLLRRIVPVQLVLP